MGREARTDGMWRAGLVALGVIARVGAILVLSSHTVARSTYEHGEIAENLLAGRGFSVRFLGADGPTSQQAPVYPYLLAAAYAVGGIETPGSLLLIQLGQALLGGVLVWAVMALAGEIAPGQRWAGRLSGLVAAVHPTLVYAATHVQVAMLAATLMGMTLWLAYRGARTGRWSDAAWTGLTLGLLVLTDPILGLAVVGVAVAWVAGRGWKESARGLVISGLVAGAVVAPWIVRNYRVHGEFVLVKSTFGYAFWQGNCALSEGTDKVVRSSVDRVLAEAGGGLKGWNEALWKARHEAGYLDDIALTREDYERLGRMSEPDRSRHLFGRAMEDLRREPGRYLTLTLRRLRYFVLFDETNPKTRSRVYRAGQVGLTGLAVIGLVGMGGELRRRSAATLVVAGLIAGFHALTIVSARFHVPIEPMMAVWGGTGVAGCWDRLERARWVEKGRTAHVGAVRGVWRTGSWRGLEAGQPR